MKYSIPGAFPRQFWLNLLPRNRNKLKALQEERKGTKKPITVLNKMQDNLNQEARQLLASCLPT